MNGLRMRYIIVIVSLFMCCSLNAQTFKQLSLMVPHYYPGEVYFQDGTHESYAEIELPRSGKEKLSVKKNKEDKKRTDIEAIDVVGIKIWHAKFPDKVHELYYVKAKKAYLQNDNQWGTPIMGNSWGIVYQCEINYEIDKKTGELHVVKFIGGTGPSTPTLYYLKRHDQQIADLIGSDTGIRLSKNKFSELFQDNAKISEDIRSGRLGLGDMQYILDEMASNMGANIPSNRVETVTTQDAEPLGLRRSVCVIKPEYTAEERELMEDYSLHMARAGMKEASRRLAAYKSDDTFGSGVLIEQDGEKYILTNLHVVGYAKSTTVSFQLQGQTASYSQCPVQAVCPNSDLALIKLPQDSNLLALSVYQSDISEEMAVVAAGFPGLNNAPSWQVTRGFVSNARLSVLDDMRSTHIIQHTAPIDPGSSGGPLLYKNLNGTYEIVGINTWKYFGREGVGLAIGTNEIVSFLDNLPDVEVSHNGDIHSLDEVKAEDWLFVYNQLPEQEKEQLHKMDCYLPLDQVLQTLTLRDSIIQEDAKLAKRYDKSAARITDDIQKMSFRLLYENYFGIEQQVIAQIGADWIGYIPAGLQFSVPILNCMTRDEATNIGLGYANCAGVTFGLYLGGQLPISVGKSVVVPRIIQSASGGFVQAAGVIESKIFATDTRVGLDWRIPFSSCDMLIGMHYNMRWFWTKHLLSIQPNKDTDNYDQYLQHGIGMSIGIGF